jgi:2'-5' RNA ligase
MKCAKCKAPATKKVIWADGRAYQPACVAHVKDVQAMLTAKNGKMTELAGVQDLSDTLDLVASAVYPDLERKPGGPDNWVEKTGGLPKYIERIAKHLHYEKGYSISRAIATAVNTVKRWARGGTVTKHGTTKHVSPATIAKASAAVAEWMAKRAAAKTDLSDSLLLAIDLTDVDEDIAFDLLDLADADIDDTDTMVALMLPKDIASKIAVGGGVPASDIHITIGFYKDVDDAAFEKLKADVAEYAKNWQAGPLKGTIGGISSFPAKDPEKGTPYWVPVKIDEMQVFYDQLSNVTDGMSADYDKYTPHVTLSYVKEGETPPEAVPTTPVEFKTVWVVRGNTERFEFPLGTGTGVELTDHAILSAGEIDLSRGLMNIEALAERAKRIADPEQRSAARASILNIAAGREFDLTEVLDLASTIAPRNARGKAKDGRNSFDNQGKWKHGFIPANRAAKEAKAKGSPIAMKRMNRLFGKDKVADDPKKSHREVQGRKAATGRAGNRHVPGSSAKRNPGKIKVDEKSTPGSEGVKDIGHLRRTGSLDAQSNRPAKALASSQKEASKSSRIPERATQNWDEIPETLKTLRNGKRYVLAEFGGKQYVTEWVGGINENTVTDASKMKVMRTLASADAAKMSASALRDLINNPRTPASVVKTARKALKEATDD